MIDGVKVRKDFPILDRKVNGKKIAYLDSAATSQKPRQVIEAISDYYQKSNANIHRGIHTLSLEATEAYEGARKKVAEFVGVSDPAEIIFVRSTTEAINLVAYSWGRLNIDKGDEIVLTVAEHHSNFVPWQQLAAENGAVIKVVPLRPIRGSQGKLIDINGELDILAFRKALTKKTKLVTFFHVSNVLGTVNDVQRLAFSVKRLAPQALVLVDGAQAVAHMPVDIDSIGCDFYAFSGHKMLGPTGIGVLWARREILEQMAPFQFGGEMISKVTLEKSTWNDLPWKFEAGTPNIEGAIGLGAAVDYLTELGMENVRKHEIELTRYALEKLTKIPEVVIYGPSYYSSRQRREVTAKNNINSKVSSPRHLADRTINRAGVVSFNIGNIPPHDVASILDSERRSGSVGRGNPKSQRGFWDSRKVG